MYLPPHHSTQRIRHTIFEAHYMFLLTIFPCGDYNTVRILQWQDLEILWQPIPHVFSLEKIKNPKTGNVEELGFKEDCLHIKKYLLSNSAIPSNIKWLSVIIWFPGNEQSRKHLHFNLLLFTESPTWWYWANIPANHKMSFILLYLPINMSSSLSWSNILIK